MDGTTRPARPPSWRLINRDYTLLWSGQAISNLGDLVFDTTLVLWIATRLAAGYSWAPVAVSGVLLAVMIPTALAGPAAGVFVDRWDKRGTMIRMDAARAALILALLPLTGLVPPLNAHLPLAWRLGAIYAIVVLATLCSLFFSPARVALIGDIVPPEQRARASGLGQMTQHIATLIGPPLAAPLFIGVGAGWALLVNALSFGLSCAAVALVHAPEPAQSSVPGEKSSAWGEARDGLRFFARSRVLMTLLGAGVVIMVGGGAMNALDVFFVTHTLHASTGLYGLMASALGAGMLLGALLTSALASRLDMARIFPISMLATAALIVLYSRLTSFAPALAVFFMAGVPMAALNVAIMPLVLQVTPREMIGRVSGVLGPAISLASVAGIAAAGMLAGTVLDGYHAEALGMTFGPVDTIFTVAGVLGLLGGLLALWGLRDVTCRAGDAGEAGVDTAEPAEASA